MTAADRFQPDHNVTGDFSWSPEEPEPPGAERSGAGWGPLVNLHYLRSELSRRRKLWRTTAAVGLLLGITLSVLMTPTRTASSTVLLNHDPQADPARAMATDVALLTTRSLAEQTLAQLHESESPEAFVKDVTSTQLTDQILQISVTGKDRAEALRRTDALAAAFMKYRGQIVTSQATATVRALQHQVSDLNTQITQLTSWINAAGSTGGSTLTQLVASRASLTARVSQVQNEILDSQVQTSAITQTSKVLDRASVGKGSGLRSLVTRALGGLIAGLALGCGYILLTATISYRARRREDVANALGAPVAVSIVNGPPTLRAMRRSLDSGSPGMQMLLSHIGQITAAPRTAAKALALVPIDDVAGTSRTALWVAASLVREGRRVAMVDLTAGGDLVRAEVAMRRGRTWWPPNGVVIHRPEGSVWLAQGPLAPEQGDLADPSPAASPVQIDALRAAYEQSDTVIAVAAVDPGLGAAHLNTWVAGAVACVFTGRSTPELIRTTGEVVRSAGIVLYSAVLFDADSTDQSFGEPQDATTVSHRADQPYEVVAR